MAQPEGSMTAGSFDCDIPAYTTENTDLFFIHRIPEMPAEWEENGLGGQYPYHIVQYQVDVPDVGKQIRVYGRTAKEGQQTFVNAVNGTTVTEWQAEKSPTGQVTKRPDVFSCKSPNDDVKFTVAHLVLNTSATPGYILAAKVRVSWDNSYTGQVTMTERVTAANKTYLPDYPVSSWHIKNCIAETYNTLLYHTLPRYSIPVCRIDDTGVT